MSLVNAATLHLDTLLTPIDERQPAGVFDEEDELFQAIDHEIVKLGSLQEASIDWEYIDEAARRYLTVHCKHLRVVCHLMAALLRHPSWRTWAQAAGLLSGFVATYWEHGYPKPGPTGYLGKRRLVAMGVERLLDAVPRLQADAAARPHQEAARHALNQLQGCAALAKLDVPTLTRLEARYQQRMDETRIPQPEPISAAGGAQVAGTAARAVSVDYFESAPPLKLGDEREAKRSLLALADYVNQLDAYDPTGYSLRRFALWAHLSTAPAVKREQRTDLMAVAMDTAQHYQDAVTANSVSPALLQRVERSVTTSPYWIRGSYLAAAIAQRLEMAEVASAIRKASERFVLRVPALKTLQFSDGRAFVDAETLAWLSGAGGTPAGVSDGREYAALRVELAALIDSGGVEPLMRRLEQIQAEADDPRHQCHVMTIAGDLLSEHGFGWMADGLYRIALNAMQSHALPAWERALHNHLTSRVREPADAAEQDARGTTKGK
ncbi:type VI secretion system protein TssA [Cupriavidus basilensis]|uniref:Type VI secretion system protein TssA n=1 Tax=Cupriavidus basilensis TaxID=68895 RepID=A0ABT6AJ61_9BURK|nr:type VI secretion system protein TssA [Cupriavidus basilensis]MDF3832637.1 type VI secretion system protein TssA [Cupriavidus basilensis]